MSKLQKYAILGAAGFGIATIVLGVIMLFIFPSSANLSEGFRTPIIAFEFAQSEADLAFLSGDSVASRLNRAKMDAGHRWDLVFPFAYAGFIALLLLQIIARGQYWLWLAIPVALLIIPFDLRENRVLLAITDALGSAQSIEALLQELYVATWLKWGALGISLAALAIGYLAQRVWLSALLALMGASSIAACRVSGSVPVIAETMSAAILLFFLYFALKSCLQAWRWFTTGLTHMFLSTSELEAGIEHIKSSPNDAGVVKKIVCRPAEGERRELDTAQLDTEVGLVGDNWMERGNRKAPDGRAHPGMQLNLMNARAIALIARREDRWQLAGDQFYVDLDLSSNNLPPGSRLVIGDAIIEVTAEPHLGCSKFLARFGRDAARFVNSEMGKSLNLRGINTRIIQPGTFRLGANISKLSGV